jgi:copper resistance protein B
VITRFFQSVPGILLLGALFAGLCPRSIQAQSSAEATQDFSKPVPANWPAPVHDNQVFDYVTFNELEGRLTGPVPSFRWDGEGWIGDYNNKLWLKSEGLVTSGAISDGDHEALYDRPIPHLRYFDWQAGVRADLDSGPARTWGAIGIQGLAPYSFDFEPTFYFRDGGHVAGRLEGSYNMYLTQRLILQTQIELNFYSKSDPARRVGSGLSDLDGGLRLGYQCSRKFAPYIGFTYASSFGQTAAFARRAGDPVHISSLVVGIWVWR